jgi:hypothetical protein
VVEMLRVRTAWPVLIVLAVCVGAARAAAPAKMTEEQVRLALRDVPTSVVETYRRCGQRLDEIRCSSVPVAFDARWRGTIVLADVAGVAVADRRGIGLWDGRGATFTITKPFRDSIPAKTHSGSWGSTVRGTVGTGLVTPWIVVDIPAFGRKYVHKRITAVARLTVRYPQGTLLFKNTSVGRSRAVSFYVVGPKELVALQTPPAKGDSSGSSSGALVVTVIIVAIAALLVLYSVFRRVIGRARPILR